MTPSSHISVWFLLMSFHLYLCRQMIFSIQIFRLKFCYPFTLLWSHVVSVVGLTTSTTLKFTKQFDTNSNTSALLSEGTRFASLRTLTIMTVIFCDFIQAFQANVWIVSQTGSRQPPSTLIPIHYSLTILTFEVIYTTNKYILSLISKALELISHTCISIAVLKIKCK